MAKRGNNDKTPLIRRILAIIGVLVLLGVNGIFFTKAVRGTFDTPGAFMTAAVSTVAIPIVVWLFVWAFSAVTGKRTVASPDPYGRNEKDESEDEIKAEDLNIEESTDKSETSSVPGKHDRISNGKVDTVIFDIGGVLADFCWEQFIKDKGYVEDTVNKIAEASIKSPAWDEFDRGVLDTMEVIQGFVKNNPSMEAELYDVFSDLSGLLRKRERTIPWIRALKKAGFKVFVLSNYSKQAEDANPFMKEFLDEVDGGILSYKEQIIKPDRKIFELICERYDLIPGKCVFIDDLQRNVDAASDFGMKSILFESYEQVDRELSKLGVTCKIEM
ncbi:haloacid dehalogenase superfamily, subfamily IA, variant 3 with third motif having DD or ED [Butyrivibrio sp. ob235]|uniref:HAD family hydrolase n=1 Tax=unclassified Butyrivibrio TaxID=2639466 RepID=UPI0003B34D5C|nr:MULTISPECIES: HAD family phosphatase [unclassified Butyrivibrio]SEL10693.1 haloacid dehalogenase superfamily, subfamily IA, variant 3 with third motif having DD or ED [Butyrivibrio sp. ob235]